MSMNGAAARPRSLAVDLNGVVLPTPCWPHRAASTPAAR